MTAIANLLEKLLGPILKKLNGWKTVVGLILIAIAFGLKILGYINEELFANMHEVIRIVFDVGAVVATIGVTHKAVKLDAS